MNVDLTDDELKVVARLLEAEDARLRNRRPDMIPYGTWDDRITARATKRLRRIVDAIYQREWKARQRRWKIAAAKATAKKKPAAKK